MEKYLWVANDDDLLYARQIISQADTISLDTEYDSFRYFRDKLCLIQIRAGSSTFLFDPIGSLDLSFLGVPLADPQVKIIAHAGDNDIRLLKRDYGFSFTNLFDTYRAAMILGFRQLALSRLARYFLGVEMEKNKKTQRSRWDIRPLEEEQLEYAALDVFYLEELYRKLNESLEKNGLKRDAAEAFGQIVTVNWQERSIDERGHLRIRGCRDLTDRERACLQKLFLWRFEKAREKNRSSFMILSDEALVKISRLGNLTFSSIASQGLLPRDKIREYGSEIISILDNHDEAGLLPTDNREARAGNSHPDR